MIRRWRAFRVALRIARRDVWRAKGRSALVVAMVALPVLGVSAADVLARTAEPELSDTISATLGAADARVQVVGRPILQDPRGQGWDEVDAAADADQPAAPSTPDGGARIAKLIPGAHVISDDSERVRFGTASGVTVGFIHELDYADPVAHGLVTQLDGRPPTSTSEVALTEKLAEISGLGLGDTLRLPDADRSMRIVGIVREPGQWDERAAYTRPGAAIDALRAAASDRGATPYSSVTYLVGTSTPLTWQHVKDLNIKGLVVNSRTVLFKPPPDSEVPYYAVYPRNAQVSSIETTAAVGAVVVVGMALLEIVLLAGPAFAVGARRTRRQLALLAATGATRVHVRDVVLAQGVVLGLVGGLIGTGLGIAMAIAGLPLAEHLARHDMPALDLRPIELTVLVGVGLITAVLAAAVPAWQASRQQVVAALAGRRGQLRTRKRMPLLGLALVGGGTTLAAYGAVEHSANAILAGSMIAEIGLVLCTPTLVGWFGRLAPRLPLAPRIALRDAARNRTRSAPAVAAVMAAVAGTVAIGSYVASLSNHEEATYVPRAVLGQTVLSGGTEDSGLQPALDIARRDLPINGVVKVQQVNHGECPDDGECNTASFHIPAANECPPGGIDWRCQTAPNELFQRAGYVIAPEQLAALTGAQDPVAEGVLRAGGAVLADRRFVHDGMATLMLSNAHGGDAPPKTVEVPATLLSPDAARVSLAIVGPALLQRFHVAAGLEHVVLTTDTPPSAEEEQALQDRLDALDVHVFSAQVERGYSNDYGAGLLALLVGSAIITLGAAGIATGLAITDARPDLATLAAVGAAPGVRRRLAMAQAGVIAALGTMLGALAGMVPAAAVVYARAHPADGVPDDTWHFALPWTHLGVTAVVVPLIAVLAAGLFVRSRIAIERHAG